LKIAYNDTIKIECDASSQSYQDELGTKCTILEQSNVRRT